MFSKDSVYPWREGHKWNEEWLTKSVRSLPNSKKTEGRNDLMINQVTLLFGSVPENLDDFIFASQTVQAEAMKYFLERWRGAKYDRTGMIWWNLRDGWPIISDAVTDYYNSKKRAYYYLQNAQRDVCAMINDAVGEAYPLIIANDTREPAAGKVTVTDVATGKTVFSGNFSVEANSNAKIASLPKPKGHGIWLIEYQAGGERLKNHYLYGEPPYSLSEYANLLKKAGLYQTEP